MFTRNCKIARNVNGNSSGSVYQQRKRMEPQIKELFRVLFTIPDKSVVARVIQAINADKNSDDEATTTMNLKLTSCPKCRHKFKNPQKTFAEAATQTDDGRKRTPTVRRLSTNAAEPTATTKTETIESKPIVTAEGVAKEQPAPLQRKRRKRKVCAPQVSHVSQAQQVQRKLLPKTLNTTKATGTGEADSVKRMRLDSFGSVGELNALMTQFLEPDPVNGDIHLTMAREFLVSEQINPKTGLLPIHEAITENQCNRLRRQIFVWKYKKVDLNELITDDDHDSLQLAVLNDSFPSIITILLENKLNVNCLDEHSNTIIHMSILHEIELHSLELLAERIDLSVLLRLNDKGHSVLHTAVRHDRFLHAEVLLNVIDKRVLGAQLHTRSVETVKRHGSLVAILDDTRNLDEEKKIQKKEFLTFYEKACSTVMNSTIGAKACRHTKKRDLLELGELCSGNTALYLAIEDRMEHFIFFLLAHLCDPRYQNHIGQDAKSYFVEFGKSLGLSLKIDRAMDKVIAIIEGARK